ncbi:MAG: diguanylate cyclase, partial [Coriobacteriales bacterium]|nr:diguanylate cyclase [Coriobacteriales bacterium]
MTKENVLSVIQADGTFTIDYRLAVEGLPTFVRLKVAQIEEGGKPLLIIGLLDEDAKVRQEQEYANNLSAARSMATVDSLTGVKNKRAYAQWEERINAKIKAGEQPPFAVVVCDINDLKTVNDLYGHKEGDACIKNACARICTTFSHSPVFRIGGDEFAVIMSGGDYDRRAVLMEQVSALPQDRSKVRMGEVIAAGMVEYQKGRHPSLLSVFEEADKAMYEKKQLLKAECLTQDQEPGDDQAPQDAPVIDVRKSILIVDDVEMNREILAGLLEEDYNIVHACDGVEALEALRSQKDEIALVLLGLYMPNMTGREVMAEMQVDEDLMSVPVIVLTVDEKAELDCLKIGAMDFIPKPYPDIEIVKARIAKCIELSENRELIRHTECDKLTGLLNRDYFFRYVSRLDHIYKEGSLDAVACDVNRFHSANKQYGRQFCDHVLRSIADGIRKLARTTGGIGCRLAGDTFLLYCPHQDDLERLLGQFVADVCN